MHNTILLDSRSRRRVTPLLGRAEVAAEVEIEAVEVADTLGEVEPPLGTTAAKNGTR
jgi:hypothetical protein